MKKSNIIPLTLLTLFLLSSCGSDDDDSSSAVPQEEEAPTTSGGSGGGTSGGTTGGSGGAEITYDSDLRPSERAALDTSRRKLSNMRINGTNARYFSTIFGGNRSSNVVNYVEARVNYAISEATPFDSRFVRESLHLPSIEVQAFNPSLLIWLESKIIEPEDLKYRINNRLIDINNTRIGVMQFGSGFVNRQDAFRSMTIVHEARHSDCTGGTWRSDIERWRNSRELPLNATCAHLHELCPPGNPYGGTNSCDFEPWGAYIIQAIYAAVILQTCTNCSEADRQDADIALTDAVIKVMDVESHLNGNFGTPNMSSSPNVREDL